MKKVVFLILLASMCLTGCSSGSTPTPSDPSSYSLSGRIATPNGTGIANVVISFGDYGTVTTSADGSWSMNGLSGTVEVSPARLGWCFEPDTRQVTSGGTLNFSADKLVAYTAEDSAHVGYQSLFLTQTDGDNAQVFPFDAKTKYWPRLSPDGTMIAYSAHNSENPNIFVIGTDALGTTLVTDTDNEMASNNDVRPNWSPDGTRVVFTSNRNGQINLWSVDIDTLQLTQLTSDLEGDYGPSWSPNGEWVVYQSTPSPGISEIRLISSTGTNKKTLSYPENTTNPHWWPDGQRICFQASGELYLADVNRDAGYLSDITLLTENIAENCWAGIPNADGSKIIFEREQALTSGVTDVWIMSIDGSGEQLLATNARISSSYM